VYQPERGELRVHAASKDEKEVYRRQFGLLLADDEHYFPGTAKYTLEPLRASGTDSLVCHDVEGIKSVRLREVQLLWGGPHGEVEIHKAGDLFAALKARGRALPVAPLLQRAVFQIQFHDSLRPRSVTIRVPNVAQFVRDGDSVYVEEWLQRRGFVVAADDPPAEVLVGA
jgi:hypothetical protein